MHILIYLDRDNVFAFLQPDLNNKTMKIIKFSTIPLTLLACFMMRKN